jgi:hypothetical protein
MRTTQFGGFEFDGLAGGAYVLKASRRGFLPAEYGQKRWNSAGMPVAIAENETAFLSLRLSRFGSIGGTLVDENDIGLPEHDVVAYRNTTPPQLVAQAATDDRGMYRIAGLEPGVYLVRTMGKQYDEGSYVPTFAKESDKVEDAQTFEVSLDYQTSRADVRPNPGPVFSLKVSVITVPPDMPVTLTLATEMGRKTVEARSFVFTGLPKGTYELYAQAPADPSSGCLLQAADARMPVTTNTETLLQLVPIQPVPVGISGAPRSNPGQIQIRRKDVTGTGPAAKLEIIDGLATLLPGTWEAKLDPPAGYYASRFSGPGAYRTARVRADGWNEYAPTRYTGLQFTVTPATAGIRGLVKSGSDPVSGAPVYAEAWDTVTKSRVGELHVARTNLRGEFAFTSLAPGTYRILSTFEYAAPDSETMEAAGAASVTVAANADAVKELELYVIR